MYLQANFSHPFLAYGMSLFNALVLSKIILIGELLHLGGRVSNRPLIFITVRNSAVFTIFYFMFHLLEDGVRGALHGKGFLDAIQAEAFTSVGGVMARLLFVFFAFIPFFALMDFLGSAHYPITLRKSPHDGQPIVKEHRCDEVASPAMYFSGLVLVPRKRRFRTKHSSTLSEVTRRNNPDG